MNIVICEPLGISDSALAAFTAPLTEAGHRVTAYADKAEGDVLCRRVAEADIAVIANAPFPAEAVAAAPRLRYLNVAFTGVDHVVMDACRARGILVSNAAGYSDQAVAELVLGQALSLLRHTAACDGAVRSLQGSAGLRGGEIAGRVVGIIGLGRIGLRVAQLMRAFGAEVIATSPHEKEAARALGVRYVSLEALLREADIVTLHAPSNASTRGMIGPAQLALMKPTAYFINCARGALVDSAALADALNTGRIAGAAVDVFPAEPPLSPDEPLLHARNCLLTPHVAFNTEESMLRRAKIVFGNLAAYLAGEPRNLV